MPSDMEGESIQPRTTTAEDQEELNASNRRKTLFETLTQAESAVDMVELVSMLGLDEELHELAVTSTERQRRLQLALQAADIELELAELAESQAERQ